MMKLTAALQKKIGRDWLRHFPELGMYKPMRLLKRNGPVLVGICLDRSSGGTIYNPTFHVHNLCRPLDFVALTLYKPLLSRKHQVEEHIEVQFHDRKIDEAAARFREQNPLLASGDIGFGDLSRLFAERFNNPVPERYPYLAYEDLISIAAWLGQDEYARAVLRTAAERIATWPETVQQRFDGVEAWTRRVESQLRDRASLAATVESEIVRHKLQALPVYRLEDSPGVAFWES